MNARWAELVGAFMLLTRLPVSVLSHANPATARCVWAYPVVGAAIGSAGALVFILAAFAMPTVLAAMVAVGVTVLLTGALHEDGLADVADGFGGGATPVRKLEIMRDSRIGTYGATALMLSLGVRVAAVAGSAHPALALLLAGVLGRVGILVVLAILGPARPDGLAATLGDVARPRVFVGLALGIACAYASPGAVLAAGITAVGMAWLARRQVGGYTGDVLGAAEQAAECGVMLVMA